MAKNYSSRDRSMPADALVVFGATGDLNVPVVGVAMKKLSLAQLRKRVRDGIRQAGKVEDRGALDQLLSLLRYVSGAYNDPHTFEALSDTLSRTTCSRSLRCLPWSRRPGRWRALCLQECN